MWTECLKPQNNLLGSLHAVMFMGDIRALEQDRQLLSRQQKESVFQGHLYSSVNQVRHSQTALLLKSYIQLADFQCV